MSSEPRPPQTSPSDRLAELRAFQARHAARMAIIDENLAILRQSAAEQRAREERGRHWRLDIYF